MMNNFNASIQLTDNYIKTYEMNLNEKISEDAKIEMDCRLSVAIVKIENKETEKLGQVDMDYLIELKGTEKKLGKIHLVIQALFSGDLSINDEKFEDMLKHNGVPMLSQIVRAYIISNTSLSGMPTIKLPMFNFVEFFKKAEEEKTNKNNI